MRLMFYSGDSEFKELTSSLGDRAMFSEDRGEFLELLRGEDGLSLVFVDLDGGKGAEELVEEIKGNKSLKAHVILTSRHSRLLKKHQRKKAMADGYLPGPLSLELVNNALNDLEVTHHVMEYSTTKERDFPTSPSLTDLRLKAEDEEPPKGGRAPMTPAATQLGHQIQAQFDDVFKDAQDAPPPPPLEEEEEEEGELSFHNFEIPDSPGADLPGEEEKEELDISLEGEEDDLLFEGETDPNFQMEGESEEGHGEEESLSLVLKGEEESDSLDEGESLFSTPSLEGQEEPDSLDGEESSFSSPNPEESEEQEESGTPDKEESPSPSLGLGERGESDPFDEDELATLRRTVKELGLERDHLLRAMEEKEGSYQALERQRDALQSELREERAKAHHLEESQGRNTEEARYQIDALEKERAILDEKVRELKKGLDTLEERAYVDFNRGKQRERELEDQLELALADAQNQVQSREKKIVELKRKIDQLEFNMEHMALREKQFQGDKYRLEENLARTARALRSSVKVLEEGLGSSGRDSENIDRQQDD